MPYFYISFATDEGFLGATVVRATDADGALSVASEKGLNPGGEAMIVEVPEQAESEPDMLAMIDRLVGKNEMLANGGTRHGDLSPEKRAAIEAAADRVCQSCNE